MSGNSKADAGDFPELLNLYYRRFFPYSLFYRWLSYGQIDNGRFFSLREFCFTLKDDVYLRYKSFETQKEMEKAIQEYCPYKIDIGPVYSSRIKDVKLNSSVIAVERELVFDIDMTDYDEVRLCCSNADICKTCWPLMTLAIKIIHRALTEDFGFQNILWVYSGRRGVHCWVADKKARCLKQAARVAIVEYLSLIKGGNVGRSRAVTLSGFDVEHHAVQKALHLVRAYFLKHFVRDQAVMESEKGLPKVLEMLEDPTLKMKIDKALEEVSGSDRRWEEFSDVVSEYVQSKKKTQEGWKTNNMLDEIQVMFCYPRLDVNVSHSVNHLLKSPFSVHPKTGRVCVPINPDLVDQFDPFTVPTISQLSDQLTAYDLAHSDVPDSANQDKVKPMLTDGKKTSLKDGLHIMENFVRKLESTLRNERIKENIKTENFDTDF